MDRCDICGKEMRHTRLVSGIFACQDCREPAMKALGVTVTSIQIGFAVDQPAGRGGVKSHGSL